MIRYLLSPWNMKPLSVICVLLIFACSSPSTSSQDHTAAPSLGKEHEAIVVIDTTGHRLSDRFPCPAGFSRQTISDSSFGTYLRQLPLKKHGAQVQTYDGRIKSSHGVYLAVVDLPIGNRDLHQCADAVMRLRAEYLYSLQQYDQIHFNFTNGFRVDYSRWIAGDRIVVQGNNVSWRRSASPSTSASSFWKYLETIFAYAGTLSLEQELRPISPEEIQIGDVWIKGGSPGHAVIVVDLAIHEETGEKMFMLAQSYMPAQEIQILTNPHAPNLSPWYHLPEGTTLQTPEWSFTTDQLRRF